MPAGLARTRKKPRARFKGVRFTLNRKLYWGLFAFLPIVGLLLVIYYSYFNSTSSYIEFPSIRGNFIIFIYILFVINYLAFIVHAFWNNKVVWAISLIFFWPFASLLYWWFSAKSET